MTERQQVILREDFINALREQGMKLVDATNVVNTVLGVLSDGLEQGKRVVLRNIGTFSTQTRKGRVGQSFGNGESSTVQIPAKTIIKFVASDAILKELNRRGKR